MILMFLSHLIKLIEMILGLIERQLFFNEVFTVLVFYEDVIKA